MLNFQKIFWQIGFQQNCPLITGYDGYIGEITIDDETKMLHVGVKHDVPLTFVSTGFVLPRGYQLVCRMTDMSGANTIGEFKATLKQDAIECNNVEVCANCTVDCLNVEYDI